MSQGPANPSPGGGSSSHGRQSSYSRARILEVGNVPQCPLWPPVGPGSAAQPPASPGFHPSIFTEAQLRNTSTQQPGSGTGPGVWRVPGEPGREGHGQRLRCPSLCGTAQGRGAEQWAGAGPCRIGH